MVTVFLIGNALCAVATAPEWVPQPWGMVGQYLPIGAGGALLRSVAYFDGHGGAMPALVLTAYAIGGLFLVLTGRHGPSGRQAPAAESDVDRQPVKVG